MPADAASSSGQNKNYTRRRIHAGKDFMSYVKALF